jgi:hypothetical protein
MTLAQHTIRKLENILDYLLNDDGMETIDPLYRIKTIAIIKKAILELRVLDE